MRNKQKFINLRLEQNFVPLVSLFDPLGLSKSFLAAVHLAHAKSEGFIVTMTALSSEAAARAGAFYMSHLFQTSQNM